MKYTKIKKPRELQERTDDCRINAHNPIGLNLKTCRVNFKKRDDLQREIMDHQMRSEFKHCDRCCLLKMSRAAQFVKQKLLKVNVL